MTMPDSTIFLPLLRLGTDLAAQVHSLSALLRIFPSSEAGRPARLSYGNHHQAPTQVERWTIDAVRASLFTGKACADVFGLQE
ncbi:hypothetical protein EDB83DRAFT_450723 [Lactarius deliciosus]|nr:hypothetical protein EDB83DRAFT_450723 [Lactarius deliciosus]